jgi:subtilisin family serine protease
MLLCCGIQTLFSQSYIIKFRSEPADTSEISSAISRFFKNPAQRLEKSVSYSLLPLSSMNRSSVTKFPWDQYVVLKSSGEIQGHLIDQISQNARIEYIHPVHQYSIDSQPNDSAYSSQWNLARIGIKNLISSGIISSLLPSILVGVIDTGIDDEHPDLMDGIAYHQGEIGLDGLGNDKRFNGIDDDNNGFIDDWRGYDFVESPVEDLGDWKERDNHPFDEHGHGTAVAGIIGARSNNGIGLAGIAPCKILPLRAFGKDGNGNDIDIAASMVYAVDNGAAVINLSFGDVVRSLFLYDAIRYAYVNDVILVASSGNDGSNKPHYPSDFQEVISTGSVNRFDSRSFFSSYSPSLDVMAPGEQIITTTMGGSYTDNFSGTSAAAPHVAGAAALIKSLEKQKQNNNPQYVPFSNAEIRGILFNAADDAGKAGWDEQYGAGILNVAKAVQAVSGSEVVIHAPVIDQILTENFIEMVLTASTPYLRSVEISYGKGELPSQWVSVFTIDNKILYRDTIPRVDISSIPDDTYILRVVARNSKGNDIEVRHRVKLLRVPPKILSLRFRDSVIIGDRFGALIESRTDRNTVATLYYRKAGDVQYVPLRAPGVQMNHAFILSTDDFIPDQLYEVYCEFTEFSSSHRSTRFHVTDSIGSPIKFSGRSIPSTGFNRKSFLLPKGFLLNAVPIVNSRPMLIMNVYDENNDFGRLTAFDFDGTKFSPIDSTNRSWIPRSFIADNGNPANILVQDRGVSQLLSVDRINGTVFSDPVWGDSSDVWASQLIDLNGDQLPEIIARNSSEFLIYRNFGNNNFSLQTRLPNHSQPLFGEARNQFGPPRSIIGDFTNTGLLEILFADYDGDLLLYRQTAQHSLQFALAGIDTSDLFEMSDFITSGDFNGDGVLDFAVAGHSDMDWNQDREYDAPVWTVRVFSHLPSNQPGTVTKIWEQHFYGVKSGSAYDNGIVSGKISTADSGDALCISFNPILYVFTWNNQTNTFEAQWMHSSQSNSVIIHDFDGDGMNELGFHTNNSVEFWTKNNPLNTTQTPWGVTAIPISENKVRLNWNSLSNNHNIYRGTRTDSLYLIATISGREMTDSLLVENVQYFYSITSTSMTPIESPKSSLVTVIPHAPATILNVVQASPTQLLVDMSFDISSNNLGSILFILNSDRRSSSVVWRSSRSVIVSFKDSILSGSHSLKIAYFMDASGMLGDTVSSFSFISTVVSETRFFVRSASMPTRNSIEIEFSERPDLATAMLVSNYSIRSFARSYSVASVSADSSRPLRITLVFPVTTDLSELSLRLEIILSPNIISAMGVQLVQGKGQVVSIAQERNDLDHIVVYPNPGRTSGNINFVNIPSNCRITIYSISGERIKIFENRTTFEGITWDIRDESGNSLSSGIYVYRVERLNNSGGIDESRIGKIAIIR